MHWLCLGTISFLITIALNALYRSFAGLNFCKSVHLEKIRHLLKMVLLATVVLALPLISINLTFINLPKQ